MWRVGIRVSGSKRKELGGRARRDWHLLAGRPLIREVDGMAGHGTGVAWRVAWHPAKGERPPVSSPRLPHRALSSDPGSKAGHPAQRDEQAPRPCIEKGRTARKKHGKYALVTC